MLPQGAPEQLPGLLHRLVEVQDLRPDDLVASKGEELAGQPGRLLRGHPDLLDVVEHRFQPRVRRRQRLDLLGGEVGITLDHVEQVVEVVRDPAHELPEALQPLRLLLPPLGALLLRDGPQPLPFGFHGKPLRAVADRGRDQRPALRGQAAQGYLGREPAAILAQQLELGDLPPGVGVAEVAGPPVGQGLACRGHGGPRLLRHQHL